MSDKSQSWYVHQNDQAWYVTSDEGFSMQVSSAAKGLSIVRSVNSSEATEKLAALLKGFIECDAIANYDSSLCWGCGERKISQCSPNCDLELARAAITEYEQARETK